MMPYFNNQASLSRQNTEEILLYQLAFEKLLGSIFSRFHSIQFGQLDAAIEQTLQEIGRFVQADRSYLFLFSEDGQMMTNTHEWCAEGISSQKYLLQNLACADYIWTLNQLSNSEYIYIPKVDNMSPSAQPEQAILIEQQIQSLLIVPLKRNTKLYGFLGFDAVTQAREWSAEDINLLIIVAKILLYANDRKLTKDYIRIAWQIADSIEEGLFVISEPDAIIWANKAFTMITGYSYDEVVGKPHFFFSLVDPDQTALQDMHRTILANGRWSGTVNCKHKDGHSYPGSFLVSTSRDENENLTRYLVIFKDITEYYKVEQERARLQKQTLIAQKLNSLSAMSAAMVHEIAQPLNSIKVLVDGMIYCQQNNYDLPQSEIFQKLSEVSAEIGRIDTIIRDMRSFASLNQSTELSSCSWNESIERALGLLGRQLAAHEIIVSTTLTDSSPQMYANPLRLDHVLVNLLVNAIQALDISEKKEKKIHIITSYTDKHAILEIADNASGIDASLHDNIFEPFFTSKQSSHGMGLGLSVVASIMTSLKGQVTVYNNDRGGATFRLELPIIKD